MSQTQERALEYLEAVRWRGSPVCPYCKAGTVCRHTSGDRANRRWQCWSCNRAFAVTVGTIFHGTHIPLQNWFLVLGLMLNANKSASTCQIARDLGMRRPTVWSMMHRIRMAMAKDPDQTRLLSGIVEADECCLGGKLHEEINGKHPDLLKALIGSAERNGQHHFSISHRGCSLAGTTATCRALGSVKRAGNCMRRHCGRKCRLLEHDFVSSETVPTVLAVAR